MRRVVIVGVIVALIAGGYFAFTRFRASRQASAQSNFQTEPARRGSLTANVGATGTVRSNQSTTLFWQTSGTVAETLVSIGDRVEQGQTLSSLAQTSLPQNVILARADLVSAQKVLDDLQNSKVPQANALQAVENTQKALDDLLNSDLSQSSRLQEVADAELALESAQQRLDSLLGKADEADIDAARAQVVLARNQLDRAREDFAPYENKPENNLTRATLQSRLAAAQQVYDSAVSRLNGLLSQADETDLALAQANLELANARLQDAKREWERVKDGPNSADIAVLEAQLEDAQRELARLSDGPDPDDIAAAEARIAAIQATLDMDHIETPFSATVSEVQTKAGDRISAGTLAFRLDDLSRLLVDVQVSEVDINRIQVGQPVLLTFDAILGKEYHGEVTEVSPVGNIVQGTVNFKVTVELVDADQDVKIGMTAAVNIVISELTNVLLVPNRAVRVRDGNRVVYILEGGIPSPVKISLGASSETDSEILNGDLKEGDLIVLNPPAEPIFFGPPGGGGPGG